MGFRLVIAMICLGLCVPASSQTLPDSAWDEAIETRKACEGEIALERERGLGLGTGKVLCEDLAKRWEKSIIAQFGAKMAERYAPLVALDALVTSGYQYTRYDTRGTVSAAYHQKEEEFGCTLLEPAFQRTENYRTPAPYTAKGHAFTEVTLRRIRSELRFCGDRQKALVKAQKSLAFHKAAGAAQGECALKTEAEANARIAMCKSGMERIRALFRNQPEPTVLERNSAYLWQAHAYITMVEVKHQSGRTSEACKDMRGFDGMLAWLALPASSFQSFLLRNITKRSRALEESCV